MRRIQGRAAARGFPLRGLLIGIVAFAAAGLWSRSAVDAAGLLIADGGFGGRLEIAEHAVRVTVNNGIAVTEVDQTFRNLENRQVEALYTFPVPRAASVSNFSMWIGGQEMVGEVVEKARAREIYESYKARRIDPGILEQTDFRTFEMRIFPIQPLAEQRVRIEYYQELDHDDDWATWVYPLATTTRAEAVSATTGAFKLDVHVKSEIPIAAIKSPSHGEDFVLARHDDSYHQASLEARGGDLNRDVVLAWQLRRPRTGLDLVACRQKGEDGYFCMLFTAGEDLAKFDLGMDYVFVLDVSGSMANDGKLGLSAASLEAFVNALGQEDRVELIAFNVQPSPLFSRLEPVSDEARAKARDFLAAQRARGGTVLKPAIDSAYRYAASDRQLNVVILSDGLTAQSERAALVALIRSRPANARVFSIGIGNDVDRRLLEQIAAEAGGLAAFISRGDDFERQARAFRRKLTRPSATDVRIEFAGSSVHDVEPARLPDLYHGSPLRLYGRYRDAGAVTVTVSAQVQGREFKKTVEVAFPKEEAANPEIERMWAWKRMDRLLKLKDAEEGGARADLLADIVRLGEDYSIASEYTSFLVLENDAEFQRWKIERRNQRRLGRDRAARESLAKSLEAIRDRAVAGLGPEALKEAPAAAPPADVTLAAPAPRPPSADPGAAPPPAPSARRRGVDFDFGGAGGGPVGPIFVALAAWLAHRKRRSTNASR